METTTPATVKPKVGYKLWRSLVHAMHGGLTRLQRAHKQMEQASTDPVFDRSHQINDQSF